MKHFVKLVGLLLTLITTPAFAQQTGFVIGGGAQSGTGLTLFNILQGPIGSLLVGQGPAANPTAQVMSGDCGLTAAGVITCTKTNGVAFGTASTATIGTSGTNVPLLNTANTFSSDQTFQNHLRIGTNTPALSSCGTSPAIIGDDEAGEVTMGTTATGCVITFQTAYAAKPICTVTWQGTPLASQSYTTSTTAITTVQTSTSGNLLNYTCRARNGG